MEVIAASKRLFESVIPKFAKYLARTPSLHRASKQLCDAVHEYGVNLRHLGIIFKLLRKQSPARQALLTEMTSRIMKDAVKSLLREVRAWSLGLKILCPEGGICCLDNGESSSSVRRAVSLESLGILEQLLCIQRQDLLDSGIVEMLPPLPHLGCMCTKSM